MNYSFSKSARKDLKGFPLNIQIRIVKKIKFFISQENPLNFAKPLIGLEKVYRFRIGNYRLIFELLEEGKEIFILKVAIRGNAYK